MHTYYSANFVSFFMPPPHFGNIIYGEPLSSVLFIYQVLTVLQFKMKAFTMLTNVNANCILSKLSTKFTNQFPLVFHQRLSLYPLSPRQLGQVW